LWWGSSAPALFIYTSIAVRQKGVIMSQLFTTGKVISNLELKASAKQNLYIHFTLVEQIGYGEQMHSQFIHVWAWGYQAEQLKRLGVRKGSIIWVSGALELEEFVNRDGSTRDMGM
jgi:single-strand binding protein